ncbi:MAG: hypothetical protein BRC31_05060, partial [Actinobacteria bacterium QS_5_72_10]
MSDSPQRSRSLVAAVAAMLLARTATNGSWRVVYPFLPEIADGLGVTLSAVGVLLFVRAAAALVAPGVPRLIDRAGHRRVMLAALVLVVAGSAAVAGNDLLSRGLWPLLGAGAGFALLGLAKPLFDVSMQGWLGARVPAARHGRVLGATELAWGLSLALAFPASWLIAWAGWTAMFWLVAGVAAAGLTAVAVVALFRVAAELLFVVYGSWLEADLGLTVTAIGAVTLIVVASELTGEGAVMALGDRMGLRRSLLAGLLGTTVAYAGLGLVGGSLAAAIVAMVAWFLLFEVTIVAAIPLAVGLGGPQRERVMSLVATVNVASTGVGALLAPPLFDIGGIGLNGVVAAV